MSSLTITNLSKRFGRKQALDDLTLTVKDGEFLVLLGPTAAGKTTTLRCVAGLEKLDSGTVALDGAVVNGLSPAERDLALVFQTYALYPRKSAFENMAFPLLARDWPPDRIRQRVNEVATLLRITELLERRPAQMSGGQQQRVALGRAMVRNPRLFLMDEPLTNLDFKLRVEMRAELKRLQSELAATFFYVTNDQVEAMSMADRIAVLDHGKLQQVDTPERIYDHPANLFVAQFVGSPRMNTINCRYDADQAALISADGVLKLPLTDAQRAAVANATDSSALIFGCRPEDVSIHADGTVDGKVFVLEPLGDRTFVDVHVGGATVRVRAAAAYRAEEGERVRLAFDLPRCHVFDAVSGLTLF
ncbi:MAG: ABC transporter ATP-binding protein [Anaerolineae bacterium]|jgi:multiple sugar transport system ATP-binding protein|nr:ABC transporter ATP-binding protein [Anaerolineae bacterium]